MVDNFQYLLDKSLALSVRQSVTAKNQQEAKVLMAEAYTKTTSGDGAMCLLSGPGIFVVALPHFGKPKLAHQVELTRAVAHLRDFATRALDVAAIALPPDVAALDPDLVMWLADDGVSVVRDDGESACARAVNYMKRVLLLRHNALNHLRSSMVDRSPALDSHD